MSRFAHLDPASTALLLVDLQNDFIHPEGAYAKGGVTSETIEALPKRLGAVADTARSCAIPTIATLFTLVSGPDGPLISDHLARLRPFLTDGDFAPGSWGQSPIDAVGVIDITVEKVAYSAFHASRLEFVLGRLGITALLVAGIVMNGGVASTMTASAASIAWLSVSATMAAMGCPTNRTRSVARRWRCKKSGSGMGGKPGVGFAPSDSASTTARRQACA